MSTSEESLALQRNTHFLGTKIRSLRKSNGLTLDDLSARCIQLDADAAPSVSYLSMIETGRRIPSQRLLKLLAEVFQREVTWFLDENLETVPGRKIPLPESGQRPPAGGIPLEPAFLFSRGLLRSALPELLSQTGTTGRQFAELLIRSYQESQQNRFPDLERAAEEVGQRRFPLNVPDLQQLYRRAGLKLRWFDQAPAALKGDHGRPVRRMVRSFFERPNLVYVNRRLEADPARLKYDLAGHLGHRVLHGGDGQRSGYATGHQLDSTAGQGMASVSMDPADILYAWRDFECSFFAGALLGPKQPFRRFLIRNAYDPLAGAQIELTPALVMRRMTAVSPYQHWHYFDAYPPGRLRAVYRGNGIPLPWGNMTMVGDPCPQWAVFRRLDEKASRAASSQISLLRDQDRWRLYCCLSLGTNDAAGNPHVISVGLDLVPALESQGTDADAVIGQVADACGRGRGSAPLPAEARVKLAHAARVLNIAWIEAGLELPARIICPRSSACPTGECAGTKRESGRPARRSKPAPPANWADEARQDIIRQFRNREASA